MTFWVERRGHSSTSTLCLKGSHRPTRIHGAGTQTCLFVSGRDGEGSGATLDWLHDIPACHLLLLSVLCRHRKAGFMRAETFSLLLTALSPTLKTVPGT